MDGLCSSPLQQYLKIRHLYSSISDESMIRKKKSEVRGRDFLSPRTLRSSGPWCLLSLDAIQATPLSPGPSSPVSGPHLPPLSGPRSQALILLVLNLPS